MTKNTRFKVICIGDSLTYGYGVKPEEAYPAMLGFLFSESSFKFNNKGENGYKIEDWLCRLENNIYPEKDETAGKNLVLLMIGTNHSLEEDYMNNMILNWNILLDNLINYGFEVWAITIPPRKDNHVFAKDVITFNNYIKSSSKPHKIIDFFSKLADRNGKAINGILQSDNLHLTVKSYKILVDILNLELLNYQS